MCCGACDRLKFYDAHISTQTHVSAYTTNTRAAMQAYIVNQLITRYCVSLSKLLHTELLLFVTYYLTLPSLTLGGGSC